VGAGVVAGALYAAVDYVLDRMLGAGTLTGSLEYVHMIWFLTLPIATGAALGLTMYRRRDRADAALREASRADSLRSKLERVERDQAVWVMAAAVLHEVNNPLHALGLLLDEAADGESPEKLLERARAHVDRIGKHVQTLRDLPRAGAPTSEGFELRALVDRVVAERALACAETHVQVVVHGSARGLADPSHVRVIVENLVDNGIHVLRDASSRQLDLELAQDGNGVVLRVRDSGPGVQEERHALFEALRTTREGGLGLGLPVARALARAMDGEVELESSRVGATVFALRLPAA
jgi:signal transduction histidine kinase